MTLGPGKLIYNSSSGTGKADRFEAIIQEMRRLGLEFEAQATNSKKDIHTIADQIVKKYPAWIAVAGGDGTIEAIAKQLIDTDIPLGIIAMGTYNNFARSLNLPLDPLKACGVIARGNLISVDVGFVNDIPFLECVGIGLDAALFPLGEEIKSGGLGKIFPFFLKAFRYRRQTISLTFNCPVSAAIVQNSSNESRRFIRHISRKHSHNLRPPDPVEFL